MPIYEFKCEQCADIFSEIRGIKDDKHAVCPKCGSNDTKKLISNFSNISGKKSVGPSCSHSGA